MQNSKVKKSLVIFIITLFGGITLSPCITSEAIGDSNLTNIFSQYQEEQFIEVTSKIFSSNKIVEIKKNVSIDDLQILDILYKNDIEAFVEKLSELKLLGNKTVKETMILIDEKSGDKTITFSDSTTNQNCFFKFFGDIFQIYYLPIPYLALQFLKYFGIFLIAPLLLILLILIERFPNFLEKLLDFIEKIFTKYETLIIRMIKLAINIFKIMGWVHCWSPIKFPIRNTVITSGSLYLETLGKYGRWNKTGTMSLIMMGFRGLWISLPPLSTPPYTPTWCIGYAKLLIAE